MELFKQKEADFKQKKELQLQSLNMQKDKAKDLERTLKTKTLDAEKLQKTINENYEKDLDMYHHTFYIWLFLKCQTQAV